MMFAILDNHQVKKVKNFLEAALWIENNFPDRQVGSDMIEGVRVSTVFLAIDHGFNGTSLWFETMIFGGLRDGYQERYETWDQAMAGHKRAVALVRGE